MTALAEQLVDGGYQAVEVLGEHFTHVTGRVVPYDRWADIGWFLESFRRGAFTGSLVKTPKVPLLLWHDNRSFPIGHAVDWDDRADGLHGRFALALTSVAQVAAAHARDEDLVGMSVGFGPVRSSWTYAREWDPDRGPEFMDKVVRHEARLLEVSLTPTPAYEDAYVYDVAAEAVDGRATPHRRNAELWLRHARRGRVVVPMRPVARQEPVLPAQPALMAPGLGQRVDDLEATVAAHDVRITTLEGLGGNLIPSLTPAAPGGMPAPQGPSLV